MGLLAKPIYKIHVFHIRSDNWHDFSHEMCAWYHKEKIARRAVLINACDIQDCAFNYAMISKSYQGCYGLNDVELAWFRWNKDKNHWEEISLDQRPKACANLLIS